MWSFLSFLPFFFGLLVLGVLKGLVIGPAAAGIIFCGNSAVIIGLWMAHFVWTYYCVAMTKRIGLVLKLLILFCLPVPLLIWPVVAIVGSLVGGIGYGLFAPLLATFEVIGEGVTDKFYHCFADGCWSTIEESCTAVRDFTDFCFHSYFSYMDELREKMPADQEPMDIKLITLPSCFLVVLIAVPVNVVLITVVALWKSPYMLFRGWKRLFEDLVGREGPFLEAACVPFAGLAILLWPLAVVGGLLASVFSSFFLGLYGGVIVHQEESVMMGLAYIVSVVSLYDEYVNDLLYLGEGSCLPRPRYRKNMNPPTNRRRSSDPDGNETVIGTESSYNSKLVSERSVTLKKAIQQYRPVQVWDWLFKSCKIKGRILLRDGLIDVKDIEECVKGNCKKLGIKLPVCCILQCLVTSAKSDSPGLVISDEVELTKTNWPRGKVFEWYVGPLFVMKEQLKGLQLDENEELCLGKLVMRSKNKQPEDWDNTGFPSSDSVRRAQLQAIIRRLQGMVASMSRIPTFRRRFHNLMKILYLEAIQASASSNHIGGMVHPAQGRDSSIAGGIDNNNSQPSHHDNGEIV
uniref:Transmembrane protein n=1 Tax=Kalanchoe fedtschenkoi TaxID=63787 RepID=A0A7N0TY20_KALFE